MRLFITLAAVSCLAGAGPLAAACEAPAVSPEMTERAKAASDAGWTREATFAFTASAEQDWAKGLALFRQLADARCAVTTVKRPDGEAVRVNRPKGEAAEVLGLLAMSGDEALKAIPAYWDEGYEGMRKMALLHASAEPVREFVEVAIMHRMEEPWKDSTILTGYEPFRTALISRYKLIVARDDDPEMTVMIRKMVGAAATRYGELKGPAMPEFLYNYFDKDL